MDVLKRLFEQHFHAPARECDASPGPAWRLGPRHSAADWRERQRHRHSSTRCARRTSHSSSFPGTSGVTVCPSRRFTARLLAENAYLEEDLGDVTLFEFLGQHRSGDEIAAPAVAAYRRAVELLPRFQVEAGRDLNYKFCYPRASFDRQSISWDLNYFKYYFLRLAGVPFNEQALEDDFGRLTRFLLSAPRDYFLYRDFQSRNIMLREGQPWFLDYQGGRKGALHYDIASLLFDGKADLPPALRQELLDHYLDALAGYLPLDRAAFLEHYYAFVYVRILQALGAYGFRGFYERKAHFLQSVPYALKNLRWLAHNVKLPIALPALMAATQAMQGSEKLQSLSAPAGGLTVRIFSFSFHRQPPADESGNGGGFVFDGRCLPNPGREERFRALTGKDQPVIDYLAAIEDVQEFLARRALHGGGERGGVPQAQLLQPHGFVRLHRRPAPLGLPGGAACVAPARHAGRRGRGPPYRAGEDGPMKAMVLGRRPGHAPAPLNR